MNERIDYEKCVSCKWCDPTQAQCYDGHLQNKKGCISFEQNNSEPTSADLQSAAINLYMLMCDSGQKKWSLISKVADRLKCPQSF